MTSRKAQSAATVLVPGSEPQNTKNLRDLDAEEGVKVTPDQETESYITWVTNERKAVVPKAQIKLPKP